MKNYNSTAVHWGMGFLVVGILLCFLGEIGWILGAVFVALGIGSVAAGFTDCGGMPTRNAPAPTRPDAVKRAEDAGAAERSAISAAVCASMADGTFYGNAKGVIADAQRPWRR